VLLSEVGLLTTKARLGTTDAASQRVGHALEGGVEQPTRDPRAERLRERVIDRQPPSNLVANGIVV